MVLNKILFKSEIKVCVSVRFNNLSEHAIFSNTIVKINPIVSWDVNL